MKTYTLGKKETHGTYNANVLHCDGEPIAQFSGIPIATTAEEMDANEGLIKRFAKEWQRAKAIVEKLNQRAPSPVNAALLDLPLRVKLINLLHKHGTGETAEKDGEKIDEVVERIVAQRDALLSALQGLLRQVDIWADNGFIMLGDDPDTLTNKARKVLAAPIADTHHDLTGIQTDSYGNPVAGG